MNQVICTIQNGKIKKENISFFDLISLRTTFISGALKKLPSADEFFLRTIPHGLKGFTYNQLEQMTNNKKDLERNLDILLDSSLFSAKWVFDPNTKSWHRIFFNNNAFSDYLQDEIASCLDNKRTIIERVKAKIHLQRKIELL